MLICLPNMGQFSQLPLSVLLIVLLITVEATWIYDRVTVNVSKIFHPSINVSPRKTPMQGLKATICCLTLYWVLVYKFFSCNRQIRVTGTLQFPIHADFLDTALSERRIICRCYLNALWSVNNPVTSLHCFLSEAKRPLDRSKYLIPHTSECTSFNPSLTLKPTIQG